MTDATSAIFFASIDDFRAWLEQHGATAAEQWVGFYKTSAGKTGITYPEAVDEALCAGWIDGLRKSLDATRYVIRFTPRKPTSIWSAVNIARVEELTRAGRMRPAGLAAFGKRTAERSKVYSFEQDSRAALGAAAEARFRANVAAWAYFQAQAPSYQRTAIWWVVSAKQEATRTKRLATLIEDSEHARRIKPLSYTPKAREQSRRDDANPSSRS